MKTKTEKLELVQNAIDAIMNVSELEEVDYHEFVDSEKSIVSKLISIENKIEYNS